MANEIRQDPEDRRRNRASRQKPKTNAPEIVRTPPKEFDRRRFALQIWTIVAIVLAISIGLSIFFRVGQITVTGCNRYSAWTVSEASGIEIGDSLLFFGKATAGSCILDALPYVMSVRFTVKLPGNVNIIIEEAPVAYGLQATDGSWWLITSEGKVAEQTDAVNAEKTTVIKGVILDGPVVGEMARAYTSDSDGAVTGADRLATALQLVQLLEANEILGEMSCVDVNNLQHLRLWYKNQYRIDLGDRQEMDTKIATVRAAIPEIGEFQTGVMELVKNGEIWKVVFTNQS